MLLSHPSNKVTDTGGKYAKDGWFCLSGLVDSKHISQGIRKLPEQEDGQHKNDVCTSVSLPKPSPYTPTKFPFVLFIKYQSNNEIVNTAKQNDILKTGDKKLNVLTGQAYTQFVYSLSYLFNVFEIVVYYSPVPILMNSRNMPFKHSYKPTDIKVA